jgi:hypothetical protein
MQTGYRFPIIVQLLTSLLLTPASGMARSYSGPYIEHDDLLVVLRPHAPEQMAAFYEARGFPQEALDLITKTCFVTVHIENRSRQVIWLDMDEWKFISRGKPLQRLDRDYWEAQWDNINLRQASRSTFGWTQLPQLRDLQPDEPVGGNIVFPGNTERFNMTLNLPTGNDRRGKLITLHFREIDCPKEDGRQ